MKGDLGKREEAGWRKGTANSGTQRKQDIKKNMKNMEKVNEQKENEDLDFC